MLGLILKGVETYSKVTSLPSTLAEAAKRKVKKVTGITRLENAIKGMDASIDEAKERGSKKAGRIAKKKFGERLDFDDWTSKEIADRKKAKASKASLDKILNSDGSFSDDAGELLKNNKNLRESLKIYPHVVSHFSEIFGSKHPHLMKYKGAKKATQNTQNTQDVQTKGTGSKSSKNDNVHIYSSIKSERKSANGSIMAISNKIDGIQGTKKSQIILNIKGLSKGKKAKARKVQKPKNPNLDALNKSNNMILHELEGIHDDMIDEQDTSIKFKKASAPNVVKKVEEPIMNEKPEEGGMMSTIGSLIAGAVAAALASKLGGAAISAISSTGGLLKYLGTAIGALVGPLVAPLLTPIKALYQNLSTRVTWIMDKIKGLLGMSVDKTPKAGAKAGTNVGTKAVGGTVAKTAGKSLLKKIPGVGIVAGVAFGAQRASKGDYVGAGLEVASGLLGSVPIVGTAASVALDAGLAVRDSKNEESSVGGRKGKRGKKGRVGKKGGKSKPAPKATPKTVPAPGMSTKKKAIIGGVVAATGVGVYQYLTNDDNRGGESLKDTKAKAPKVADKLFAAASVDVQTAIKNAASKSGVPIDILLKIAYAESRFKPTASARPASSAEGLYQFLDGTWASYLKNYGREFGVPLNASKFDPQAAAYMGAAYIRNIIKDLKTVIANPGPGAVYLGFFLGIAGAKSFFKALVANPNQIAAEIFPRPAKANPNIFYAGGQPMTLQQVYKIMSDKVNGESVDVAVTGKDKKVYRPTLPPNTMASKPSGGIFAELMQNSQQTANRLVSGSSEQVSVAQKPGLSGGLTQSGRGTDSNVNITPVGKSTGKRDFKLQNSSVDFGGLNDNFKNNFELMATEYKQKTGNTIQVNSGYRSIADQAALYKAYQEGRGPLAGRPGGSMHNYGAAIDINSSDGDALDNMGLLGKYGFGRPLLSKGERWHIQPNGLKLANVASGGAPTKPDAEGSMPKAANESKIIKQVTKSITPDVKDLGIKPLDATSVKDVKTEEIKTELTQVAQVNKQTKAETVDSVSKQLTDGVKSTEDKKIAAVTEVAKAEAAKVVKQKSSTTAVGTPKKEVINTNTIGKYFTSNFFSIKNLTIA